MKFKIAIARLTQYGQERIELANFVSNAWQTRLTDPDLRDSIGEMIDLPISRFPTDVARNCIVEVCQQQKVDFLFQLDEDSGPPYEFFKEALTFLMNQAKPSVVGCPYLAGDGECQVFRFVPAHSPDPKQPSWKITRVPRPDAFQRKGYERVASIGTHSIAYDMRVFNEIKQPYYRYGYNANHTQLLETEEMACHRNLMQVGVPIWVNWNLWSSHYKVQEIAPLANIPPEQLPDFWRDKAKEYYLYSDEGRKELAACQQNIEALHQISG
jgi:hypothetical protein